MRLLTMAPNKFSMQLLCCFLVFNIRSWTYAEVFTAISEVEPLLVTHKKIIDDLDDYIDKEEERLITLKKQLNLYRKEHEKAMEDIPNYLGNPINAFTLIKRLTSDLDYIDQRMKMGLDYVKNKTISTHSELTFPTLEDLTGAALALTRLQETYNLDVKELAEGVLNGVSYSTPMTAGDCFELGRALYNEKDYKNSLAWMMETLRKFKEEEEKMRKTFSFSEIDILEYISFTHYLLGDVKTALVWTQKLLEVDPNHVRARGNIPHYQKTIKEEEDKVKKQQRGDMGEEVQAEKRTESDDMSEYLKERHNYEILCRGEMDVPSEVARRLHCRYLTENHPFLRLAPIKMEYMYLQPDVVVFHDVMSDNEITFIQNAAKPRFKRAVVHDPRTGSLIPAHYRISKSAWLKDEEDPLIARVSQRVADMTGLSMDSAEDLQVVNYGIGGHYEPHYDFARRYEEAFKKYNGNRIATLLFYMSDVAQGGATVFTKLGLSLWPKKGTAAFWLNLHPSGEGDLATRHAACPVLRGSKWVSNKWLHQGGQELLRPCNLEYQQEETLRKIHRPVPKSSR